MLTQILNIRANADGSTFTGETGADSRKITFRLAFPATDLTSYLSDPMGGNSAQLQRGVDFIELTDEQLELERQDRERHAMLRASGPTKCSRCHQLEPGDDELCPALGLERGSLHAIVADAAVRDYAMDPRD